jgi:SAM-dependent methyltransferase
MAELSERVHPAARGFDSGAEAYERGRPDYPASALAHLAAGLHLGPGVELLELASGTGKLTRGLLPFGVHVVAVEPSAGMRETFRRTVPGVTVQDGTAEAIPRPDASADAVVVGQAFHWFRPGPSLREIRRVLRPRGRLGLVWNRRDESVPWVVRFGHILHDSRPPGTPDSNDVVWQTAFDPSSGFAPLESATFVFEHEESVDQVIDRAVSVSYIAVQPPDVRAGIAAQIRSFLLEDPDTAGRPTVRFPYQTEVYLTQRAD